MTRRFAGAFVMLAALLCGDAAAAADGALQAIVGARLEASETPACIDVRAARLP